MRSLQQCTQEIEGYRDLRETIQALEKIAASDLHTLKAAISELRRYQHTLQSLQERLMLYGPPRNSIASDRVAQRTAGKELALLFIGTLGLTGDLWERMAHFYRTNIRSESDLILVGADADHATSLGLPTPHFCFDVREDEKLSAFVTRLRSYLHERFSEGVYAYVTCYYPEATSIGQQEPVRRTLLPFSSEDRAKNETDVQRPLGLPIFTASPQQIHAFLETHLLDAQIHATKLATRYSELAARTINMEHAGQKTDDLIDELTHTRMRLHRDTSTQRQLNRFLARAIM